MTKYLDSHPFSVGGHSSKYADGWDAIFAKCPSCGRRKSEKNQPLPERRLPDVTNVTGTMWRPCADSFHDPSDVDDR